MAKLQLNNLYGYFGRKQIGLTTLNVKNVELTNVLLTRVVKSLTPINDDYTTVLTYSNINYSMLEKLQNQFKSIGSDQHHIMSNVAIASAVTAYARIVMIPYKIDPNTLLIYLRLFYTLLKTIIFILIKNFVLSFQNLISILIH